MAIQRCPYCKAIIDEGAEYCTNCGTKLLFPEDEFIEEEMPGEKIIDVDEDLTGTQHELEEKAEPEKTEEETPLSAVEETGEAPLVDEDAVEAKSEEAAADAEEKAEPGEDPSAENEKSKDSGKDATSVEQAAVEAKESAEEMPPAKKIGSQEAQIHSKKIRSQKSEKGRAGQGC
jgi:hypothetical protein